MCPVYAADLLIDPADLPAPNPNEVMDTAWATWNELRTAATATPFEFSPWCVLHTAEPAMGAALG